MFGLQSAKQGEQTQTEYLRLHIRAHSNAQVDQSVKYAVKDELTCYLTPYVAQYTTRGQAVAGLRANLQGIRATAERVLEKGGFFYGAKAEVRTEYFPTRVYEAYTLPAGEYLALIVELGDGKGDNWWCVVYPPLCFTSANGDTVYKSKIAEIIRRWQS